MKKISETNLIINKDGSVYHLGLRPDQVADQIIAVGDPDRVGQVSRHFDRIEFKGRHREFITHTGRLGKNRLSVISTGIGPDNVEIFFNEVDALVNVDFKTRKAKVRKRSVRVIRLGTSGSMRKDVPVGSLAISELAIGLDNLIDFYCLKMSKQESSICSALKVHTGLSFMPYLVRGSTRLLKEIGGDLSIVNTVTSPGFYAPQGRQVRLPIRYPHLVNDLKNFCYRGFTLANFEMETAAYYALGKLLGHETISVSAIIANRVTKEFSRDPTRVVDSLIQKVLGKL